VDGFSPSVIGKESARPQPDAQPRWIHGRAFVLLNHAKFYS
jgi:hypothetical protein